MIDFEGWVSCWNPCEMDILNGPASPTIAVKIHGDIIIAPPNKKIEQLLESWELWEKPSWDHFSIFFWLL